MCDQHKTVFETREERLADGRQVDPKWMQEMNLAGGMGGLTGFVDLADGVDREKVRSQDAIMSNLREAGNNMIGFGG